MDVMTKALGGVPLIAALMLVAGCAAVWEEVTPEQIALEVIVKDGTGPGSCLLNAHQVGAATHPVAVISEHGVAHVRILDHADTVVFEADSVDASGGRSEVGSDSPPDVVVAGEGPAASVGLLPGDYRVECSKGASVSTTTLHVEPSSGSRE